MIIAHLDLVNKRVAAVSLPLASALAAPLGLSALLLLGHAAVLIRRAPKAAIPQPVGRAFNPLAVLLFVAVVGGFSLTAELLIRWLGTPGALAAAAVMGLADAHAAAVSMATLLAGGRMAAAAAAVGVVLALTTNMAVKVPTAFVTGGRCYGRRVSVGVGLLLTGLWLGGLVLLVAESGLAGGVGRP